MALTALYVIVGHHFEKRSHLALCTLSFAGGVGILVGGPLLQHLLFSFGIHGTFLILGGAALNVIPQGYFMRSRNKKTFDFAKNNDEFHNCEELKNLKEKTCNGEVLPIQEETKMRHIDIFKSIIFWPLVFQISFWHISLSILYYHLQAFSIHDGVSEYDSSLLLTIAGAANTVNRILTGFALTRKRLNSFLLNFISSGIVGVAVFLAPFYNSTYAGKSVLSIFIGLFTGSLTALIAPVCIDAFGIRRLSSAIGAMHLSAGIGMLIGPPLAEVVVGDARQYDRMFYVSGIYISTCSIVPRNA